MSKPVKENQIRALSRGLEVIEHLSRDNGMSLADLRKATGLRNPTLLRILGTLQNRSWVRRNIVEGVYELSHSLRDVLGETSRAHPLAELAVPTLMNLKSRQPGFPSDICAVLKPGLIEIVESTRLRGPMAVTRTGLGLRPSMVLSAHGRTILAHSPEEITKAHLERIAQTGRQEEKLWLESGKLDAELKATRVRGYGIREPGYWAPPFDPGPELGAFAVPIKSKSGIHGSMSLLWMTDHAEIDDVLGRGGLEDLKYAATKIEQVLDLTGITAPLI